MDTLVQSQPVKVSRIARLRNRASSIAASAAGLLLVPIGAASATVPDTDLTGGSGDTFFAALTGYFQDHVIVAVLALAALTIGVGMLLAWGRKAAHQK